MKTNIKIPLNSAVDVGTYDIIQDDITLKRKNSIMHKGVLSNITTNSGNGVLSTTGRNITIENDAVKVDNDVYSTTIEAVVTKNESIDSNQLVIQARFCSNEKLFHLEQIDATSLLIKNDTDDTSLTVTDTNALWVSGYIFDNGNIIVVKETKSGTSYYINAAFYNDGTLGGYTLISKLTSTYSHGSNVSGYRKNNQYVIGLDDTDLRKRWIFPVTFSTSISYSTSNTHIHGFGLISDEGIITGEPHLMALSDNIYSWENLSGSKITLDNGVIQWQPFSPTASSWSTKDSAGNTNTYSQSLADYNADIAAQNATYNTSNSGSYPPNAMNPLLSGSEINKNTYIYFYFKYDGFTVTSSRQVITKQLVMSFTGLSTTYAGSFVYYIDYSDPIGTFSSSPTNGEQVFPHWRWFFNTASSRGKYWDYGKGWARFTVGSHYVQYFTDQKVTLLEQPLMLWTIDKDHTSINCDYDPDLALPENLELLDEVNVDANFLLANASNVSTAKLHFNDSDAAKKDWPSWLKDSSDNIQWSAEVFCPCAIILTLGWFFRVHIITSEMINGEEYYWNHSYTQSGDNATLTQIPFSVPLTDNLKSLVYNGVQTSLQFNKTLLFTPQSMEDKYSFSTIGTKTYITIWNSTKIQYVEIDTDYAGKVKVNKLADYIYGTNIIGRKNVLIENRNGSISFERAFIPYAMQGKFSTLSQRTIYCAPDGITQSNDIYYYGAGFNVNLNENNAETSFLLPQVVIPCYVDSNQTSEFTKKVLDDRLAVIVPKIEDYMYPDEVIDAFYTHSRATTDNTYKESRKINNAGETQSYYDQNKADTSWWVSGDTIIYPIGICSNITGTNYITSTVDVGNNYYARFYTNNNKTFLSYNSSAAVYFGSQIFTIMSGNYYFDGQAIYYLGSQDDYSQNVFTAYAIGMKFLANSSSEAYFYAEWDKSIYLYTASNTVQKAWSFADVGNIIDAAYSSAEQALYILFDDNKLWIRTQTDNCLIEDVTGDSLVTTSIGCFVKNDEGYTIYNPYRYEEYLPLEVETEWLGDTDKTAKFAYCDIVLLNNEIENTAKNIDVYVLTLEGNTVKKTKRQLVVKPTDWKNQLYRLSITPEEVQGNAFKIILESSDFISIHSMTIAIDALADRTAAPRNGRR